MKYINNNIFIPKTIKVGFQQRDDTYTKKLAYIIYIDQFGKVRKEASWNSWRDDKIEPQDFDNEPTSGFVLNKKVGGYQYHYDMRQTYVRVYDPRGFEFEITIPNLLYILENTNSIEGKGLDGDFVYGWSGTDLLLIPSTAPEYEELIKFNDVLQENNFIKAKDLIIGATYQTKDNRELIYMGRFDYYEMAHMVTVKGEDKIFRRYSDIPTETVSGSGYWRYNREQKIPYKDVYKAFEKHHYFAKSYKGSYSFEHYKSVGKILINTISSECVSNYADIFDILEHQSEYSPFDREEYVPYTREEFYKRYIGSADGWWVYGNVIENDKPKSISFSKTSSYEDLITENTIFKNGNNSNDKITLAEIYEKYTPYHINKYLANGKLYKGGY